MNPANLMRGLIGCSLGFFLLALTALAFVPPSSVSRGEASSHFYLTPPIRAALAARPDLGNSPLDRPSLSGKVVVVTFFASWCGPCRVELATLKGLYGQYRDRGVEVVAVNYFEEFDGYSNPEKLGKFLDWLSPDYTVVKGDEGLSQTFGEITRIPTLFVFDRQGKNVHRFLNTGPGNSELSMEFLGNLVSSLL